MSPKSIRSKLLLLTFSIFLFLLISFSYFLALVSQAGTAIEAVDRERVIQGIFSVLPVLHYKVDQERRITDAWRGEAALSMPEPSSINTRLLEEIFPKVYRYLADAGFPEQQLVCADGKLTHYIFNDSVHPGVYWVYAIAKEARSKESGDVTTYMPSCQLKRTVLAFPDLAITMFSFQTLPFGPKDCFQPVLTIVVAKPSWLLTPDSLFQHGYWLIVASLYHLTFLEKYISVPTMRNNPMLPSNREKSC